MIINSIIVVCVLLTLYCFLQTKHTLLRVYGPLGLFRYFAEWMRPFVQQYWVRSDTDERPFTREQRSTVYRLAKDETDVQGFGSIQDFDAQGHLIIKQRNFGRTPTPQTYKDYLPCAKVIGPGRRRPYRPQSIINISGMSFGALSKIAVRCLNKGAYFANAYQNTGEGGLSTYHLQGGDLILQIGTGYFGYRNADGTFCLNKLIQKVQSTPKARAIEIKISQGAKPGKGGILPGKKVNKEIADARGIQPGVDAKSPECHSAFDSIPGLIVWIEEIAQATGLPVGIKMAIGHDDEIWELAKCMAETSQGPDFITIDGGEGGTGAAPTAFADSVSLPFREAFYTVYTIFQHYNLTERIVFIGSGKLGFAQSALAAFAMGCDLINIAREGMFALGCIQALLCHTDECPSGVATQKIWRQWGINFANKSVRMGQYLINLRKLIHEITHSAGYIHPAQFRMDDVLLHTGDVNQHTPYKEIFGYEKTPVPLENILKAFDERDIQDYTLRLHELEEMKQPWRVRVWRKLFQ